MKIRELLGESTPTIDNIIVAFCGFCIVGTFGGWECENYGFMHMCVQIAAFAAVGYAAGIWGVRRILRGFWQIGAKKKSRPRAAGRIPQ